MKWRSVREKQVDLFLLCPTLLLPQVLRIRAAALWGHSFLTHFPTEDSRLSPEFCIACGISGAIQHMSGCRGAKRILVINTDPEAPILQRADYAVIGDLHEVLPALSTEIDKLARA